MPGWERPAQGADRIASAVPGRPFVAFDLLRRDGDDMRLWPIEARREALMRLVAGVDACSRMHASSASRGSCRSARAASICSS